MVSGERTIDLYQEHAKALIGYATVLVGPSYAEDLVADAMVGVLARADLGRVASPRAYLFRCVLNQARQRGRSNRARRERERRFASRAPVAQAPVAADELGVFGCLSARQRAVVFLTYWEDLTVADVAEHLGSRTAPSDAISHGRARSYERSWINERPQRSDPNRTPYDRGTGP